jgi:Fic family protein
MTAEVPEPLTPNEASEVDAKYVPFPPFSDWPGEVPRMELWERDLEELREVSASASDEEQRRAQSVAMRAAAFDSGAIEGLYPTDRGLTLTVATQAAAWEQAVDERSEDARALFEAQLDAFELVLDLIADRFPKVTQAWIRRLHEEITAAQTTYTVQTPVGQQAQPLPKGKYKEHPNHVRASDGRVHAYAPVDRTPAEMQRLLDELESPAFANAHPILQASYAHYAFVAIHPFADGNGRVARAVASVYTYRDASVPLLVLAHQRDSYFSALARADSGDAREFVDFTAAAVREAIELVTESLKTAQAPQPADVLDALREMFVAQGDLSHRELDRLANEFVDLLAGTATEQIRALALPDGIEIEVVQVSGENQSKPPDGFRSVVEPRSRWVQLQFSSPPPGQATHQVSIDLFVATGSDSTATLLAQVAGRPSEQLTMSQADLLPQPSSAAQHRVSNYVQRQIGVGLTELYERAKKRLQSAGY